MNQRGLRGCLTKVEELEGKSCKSLAEEAVGKAGLTELCAKFNGLKASEEGLEQTIEENSLAGEALEADRESGILRRPIC